MELVGCDLQTLKEYIEKQFKEGMTWENHGFYGWHIDHIIPFSLDKTKELLFENLITLCPQDHFFCGHLNFYKSWNKNVKEDARNWHDKIYQRP